MPYNIGKKFGGDTPSADAHMERVVKALMREGHSKSSAIAIAKAAQEKSFEKHHSVSRFGASTVRTVFHGEFDPGSGRTLAACLTHASRAERLPSGSTRAANG